MKSIPIFLFSLTLLFSAAHLSAQNRPDPAAKKNLSDYKILSASKGTQNRTDTTPKPPVPAETTPANNNPTNANDKNDQSNTNKPSRKYVPIDTVRPVPVETNTYAGSVLRLEKIYVNDDALELIRILNPEIADKETVMSNYKL
ncbi:MAG: hypothetical protein ABIO82_03095, partial [Ginsengibacter sp.]